LRSAALGHARLSIIDIEGGAQPLVSPNESIVAVVNGEFYGHEQIREELVRRGHRFKTKSDSEIVIALYQEHGVRCLEHLRGEFAFVLYDRHRNQLFAARDRFGIKPLFYGVHDGVAYFGSEIKALVAAGVPAVWDEHSYPSRSFSFGSDTLFKDIKSLAPGTYCIASKQGLRFHRYWDLSYPVWEPGNGEVRQESIVSEIRAGLEDAVRVRMRADVPVACYLSGGVDSSAVLAIASRVTGKRLPAFTIAFERGEYDESAHAEEMARHVDADHHRVDVSSQMLADNFDRAIWHNEYPFFNAHGIGKFLLSAAVREAGYKVVLTGEGADEIFAGYPHFRRDNDRVQYGLEARAGRRTYTDGIDKPRWLKDAVGCDVSWIENQHGMISRIMPLIEPALRAGTVDPIREFINGLDVANKVRQRHPVHVAMYLWAKSFLPSFILTTLGDRMEMAHSIEGRVPFLDHHLAQMSFQVPVPLLIQGASQKHVFREAISAYVPDSIRLRKKHYFRAPPAMNASQSPMWEKIFDTLGSASMQSVPFFEKKALRAVLDVARTASGDELQLLDPVLTEMASLGVMQDQFSLAS
jgi:asparagine synthase (glutamine-hydrolysing)